MADDDETCGFRINTEYARNYNTWRGKEELQKLKDRLGNVDEDEDSSTSESEDEDAEELTAQVEKDWLRTFAAVKTKNPKIYDKDVHFFKDDEEEDNEADNKRKKKTTNKPMYIKDYDRKVIMEKGGVISESEDDDDMNDVTEKPGYYEEQEEIKKSIAKVMDDEGSHSDDDLLSKRKKTSEETEKDEQDYHEWLKGQKPDLENDVEAKTDLEPLKEMWSDPKLDDGDKFLRDYILNKRYLDDDEEDRIPTYEEITKEDLSDDELLVEKQETFERKYNFRFEEPDEDFIKSYPRTIGDTVRRKDDRRVKKRAEIKERKEMEKEKRREEIKQLKNLKRREIMTKLDQLKQITGNDVIGISEQDIEGDFDPKDYDKMMEKAFNEDYYDDDDEEKPVFSDNEELGLEDERWDEWAGPAEGVAGGDEPTPGTSWDDQEGAHCEDPDFNMDADYDPNADRSFGLDGRSKKKKKSKFKQALEKKKPEFDPNEKTFEEYFDEYYKLDYEDMIGDQPCRFKYRQVPANDYGLSVEEILKCDDKELNAWVSLKKMSQYKTEEDEYYDKKIFSKKARNHQKKLNILQSLAEKEEDEEEEDEEEDEASKPEERKQSRTMKKRQRRKQRQQEAIEARMANGEFAKRPGTQDQSNRTKKGGTTKGLQKKVNVDNDSEEVVPERKRKLSVESSPQQTDSVQKVEHDDKDTSPVNKKAKKDQASEETDKAKKDKSEKQKGKKTKQKKQGAGVMSDERLKAFGINPKKFKYTHLPKLKEKRKKERQDKKNSSS